MQSLKGHTLLYAEDEAIIRMGVSQRLKPYFKELYIAKDGQETMDTYHRYHPDVLLLDIEMPYKSGIEIAKEVRQNDPNIPIVLLTAYSSKTLLEEASKYDLVSYLIKPLEEDKLLKTLHQIAERLSI